MKYLVLLVAVAFIFSCSQDKDHADENGMHTHEDGTTHTHHDDHDGHDHDGQEHSDKNYDLGNGKYGLVAIDEGGAVNASELFKLAEGDSEPLVIKSKGKITQLCPSAQCWVMVEGDNGKEYLVKFKDEFSVPKDVVGKDIVFQGVVSKEQITVGELRADAMKRGMSQADAEKITEPDMTVKVVAEGVIIK